MTLVELQAKRESILQQIEVARVTFGERSVEYGDKRKALELIDAEIAKLEGPQDRQFTIQTKRGLQ
jgi:hypothetical protein